MKCPRCNKSRVEVIFDDSIKCPDCNKTIVIDYCTCSSCNYTFRATEDQFIDEIIFEQESLDEAMEACLEIIEKGYIAEEGTMTDLLTPCVRCGSINVLSNEDNTEYECLACDFAWEIVDE